MFKTKNRRKAERAVARAYDLRDDGLDAVKRGGRRSKIVAKRSAQSTRAEAKKLAAVARAEAAVARRRTVRTGENVAGLVRENPAATIGGALALAVAIGAGFTYLNKR